MKEQQIWIKTMDSAAEVGNLILALFEEDEDYSGEMRVLVGKPESGGYEKLSHIYDLSSMAVNVMKEHYGDRNVEVITKENGYGLLSDYEKGSMEAIEEQLKNIDHHLESISGSLKKAFSLCNGSSGKRCLYYLRRCFNLGVLVRKENNGRRSFENRSAQCSFTGISGKEIEPWNSQSIAEAGGERTPGRGCYSFYVHSSGRLLSARE